LDIRWAKERALSVAYWSIVLLGALLAAGQAESGLFKSMPGVPVAACILVPVLSTLWLVDLHLFAKSARRKVSELRRLADDGMFYPTRRAGDPDHIIYLAIQSLAVIAVSVVVGAWFFLEGQFESPGAQDMGAIIVAVVTVVGLLILLVFVYHSTTDREIRRLRNTHEQLITTLERGGYIKTQREHSEIIRIEPPTTSEASPRA
jgi:uncharacterized membrane protein